MHPLDHIDRTRPTEIQISQLCQYFLGCPYQSSPCGEGAKGVYDQRPLFRFDAFDCVTFVTTIIALWLAKSTDDIRAQWIHINYKYGQPDYLQRCHFMSADWNPLMQQRHILQDVTQLITDTAGAHIYETAITEIDRRSWLLRKTVSDLWLPNAADMPAVLKLLHQAAMYAEVERVSIDYLPLDRLTPSLLTQFPTVGIVEIVRPNWDLREQIGTQLHVSHLGVLCVESGVPMFYHASSEQGGVVRVPLWDYLVSCRRIPSIGGVHLQSLVLS